MVVDGGRGGARARAAALVAADPRVRVLARDADAQGGGVGGRGAAVRTGLRAVRMPWVLLTDAAPQYDLTTLSDFLPAAVDHDLLVGYRVLRLDPLRRRAASATWNAVVRATLGVPVRDAGCGLALVRRSALAGVRLTADGELIGAELVAALAAHGARIAELGIRHRPPAPGHPGGPPTRVGLGALAELRRIRARTRAAGAAGAVSRTSEQTFSRA